MIQFIFAVIADVGTRTAEKVKEWSARSDAEIVAAIVGGDTEAFNWLVKRYWKSMHRVVHGIVKDDMAAQEVVQEVWLTVHKELKNFRQESSLKNWMFRILTNRAFRVSKKESKTVAFSQLGRNEENSGMSEVEEFTQNGKWKNPVHNFRMLDPQEQAINAQGLRLLSKFIEELPDVQRVVVTMRDVEGLDTQDVCELLDMTPANQRVLLHRARTTLRRRLEAEEREAE